MFLYCRRKAENSEMTHTGTGKEHANFTQKSARPGIEPATFLLQGFSTPFENMNKIFTQLSITTSVVHTSWSLFEI